MSKIGGIPWGLPSDHWPSCCGRPQKLLAQLCHEPPMLDLGFPGAVLHLFQCLECCGIDEYGRDAFVIDGAHLGNGLVRVPEYDRSPDLGNALIGEFWITGWEEHEDGIPAARLAEFFIEEDLWALQDEIWRITEMDWQWSVGISAAAVRVFISTRQLSLPGRLSSVSERSGRRSHGIRGRDVCGTSVCEARPWHVADQRPVDHHARTIGESSLCRIHKPRERWNRLCVH